MKADLRASGARAGLQAGLAYEYGSLPQPYCLLRLSSEALT
jgi:hypothetical protein